MIMFEITCLIGIAIMFCALAYEQRHHPVMWVIAAQIVFVLAWICWLLYSNALQTFTVVS